MPHSKTTRVWDLPTRFFHWLLAACVIGSVVSAKIGGNAIEWHMKLGYLALTLITFRIVWGLVGGRWSRFASFIYGPAALIRYLRGQPAPGDRFEVGHSPLGALSVFAMLAWLLVQIASGLIADDEIATTGPLQRFVSNATSLTWTSHHKTWGQWGIYLLVGLHMAAILYYVFGCKKTLVKPMVSGDKQLGEEVPASQDGWANRLVALVVFAVCAAAVYKLVTLG